MAPNVAKKFWLYEFMTFPQGGAWHVPSALTNSVGAKNTDPDRGKVLMWPKDVMIEMCYSEDEEVT